MQRGSRSRGPNYRTCVLVYVSSNPVNRASNDCFSEVSVTVSRAPTLAKYSLIEPLKVVWAHWRMWEIQTSYVTLK